MNLLHDKEGFFLEKSLEKSETWGPLLNWKVLIHKWFCGHSYLLTVNSALSLDAIQDSSGKWPHATKVNMVHIVGLPKVARRIRSDPCLHFESVCLQL